MTAIELNPELRKLIDARLDLIDRTLIRAEVAWSERRSIVGEVETQIFELLARRGQIPTQEDVRAVLDSLDPPEAFIPESLFGQRVDIPVAGAERSNWSERVVRLMTQTGSVAACTVSLLIINGIVVLIIAASDGVIQWIVTLAGLAWLNYAAVRRLRRWSAARHGRLLDDVRNSLAAWLMPKNGAPAR
jgi:hypothetical protein